MQLTDDAASPSLPAGDRPERSGLAALRAAPFGTGRRPGVSARSAERQHTSPPAEPSTSGPPEMIARRLTSVR